MKYGKLPAKLDTRTLNYSTYAANVVEPPPAVNWSKAVDNWPMMLNDRIGDCTCAAAGHLIQCWTANAAERATVPTDDEVVTAYSAVAHYDPATGANDNGAVELDVLNFWRQIGIAGNRLAAYTAVDPTNADHIRQAIWLFGGLYLGLVLPQSAEQQTVSGKPWISVWYSPIVGGHAVPAVGYDDQYVNVVTWGQVQLVAWEFLTRHCEEAYALVDQDWIRRAGTSPSGFDMASLEADLAEVTS